MSSRRRERRGKTREMAAGPKLFPASRPLHRAFHCVQRKNHPNPALLCVQRKDHPNPNLLVQAQWGRQGVSGGQEGGLLGGTHKQPPSRPLTEKFPPPAP